MDVDRDNFFKLLPQMLHQAQHAHFVAIDVEMTGIYLNKIRHSSQIHFQDLYTKVKEAAEEYQIVQIGFTFFHYEEESAEYKIHTFNCQVSPMFPKGFNADGLARFLDRKFSILAKSYGFLQRYGCDVPNALNTGIFYMNRDEQRRAEKFCANELADDEHVDLQALDEPARQFYEEMINRIAAYVTRRNPKNVPDMISNPNGEKLNNLQARLVYQIIREEHPNCVARRIPTGPQKGFISVRRKTRALDQEAAIHQRAREKEVRKLTGLQILFEALCGGSFASKVNRAWVYDKNIDAGVDPVNDANRTFDFYQCEASLKENGPVLVGHNILYDLLFIYRTFYEPLPPKIEDFLARIHELFPRIADTKYMRARNRHMMQPDWNLVMLRDVYAKQQFPVIRYEPEFGYDANEPRPHHAGSDSFMTAHVFLRQSYDYFNRKMHKVKTNEQVKVRPSRRRAVPNIPSEATSSAEANNRNLLDDDDLGVLEALQNWSVLEADQSASRRFSGGSAASEGPAAAAGSAVAVVAHRASTPEVEETEDQPVRGETHSAKEGNIIPLWTHEFWQVYGNKTYLAGIGTISFV
ncbi:CAF1-domain-containing protein [Whalleya microplaca]|nr:CAF1-domain-containing protein [Whalleya microplaca]